MPRHATPLTLRDSETRQLHARVRDRRSTQQPVLRSRIVLLAAQQWENRDIATELETTAHTAGVWRRRFIRAHLAGLEDAPRSGRPAALTNATVTKVLTTVSSHRDFAGDMVEHVRRAFAKDFTSRQLHFELPAKSEGAACSKSWGVTEEWSGANKRSSAAGQLRAGDATAFHLAFNLPRDDRLSAPASHPARKHLLAGSRRSPNRYVRVSWRSQPRFRKFHILLRRRLRFLDEPVEQGHSAFAAGEDDSCDATVQAGTDFPQTPSSLRTSGIPSGSRIARA